MHEVGQGTILATSRTLSLKPSEAKTAMESCIRSFTEASSGSRGELRLNLGAGGRALLRPVPLHGASATQRCVLAGTIRSRRGWVSVPVEIETTPLTETCSELVVRPVGPICLRSAAHRRLFDRSSHTLADLFRMEIELAGLGATTSPVTARTLRPHTSKAVSLPV